MGQNNSIDPSLLVEQSRWVYSLAHHLVRDPCGADDVAQETLLAALAAPPRDADDERRLRAWLGRVAFNLANLSTRRNMRRRAREERVAQSERQTSAADSFVRRSVLDHVGEAVTALAEPYRTAVELRYFQGLTTADIAVRTETSESAVRKRLWRARGQLRDVLDARHNGERHAWFAALAPLVLPEAPATTASTASTVPAAGAPTSAALAIKVAAAALVTVGATLTYDALERDVHANERRPIDVATVAAARASVGSGRTEVAPGTLDRGARHDASPSRAAHAPRSGRIEVRIEQSDDDRDRERGEALAAIAGTVYDLSGIALAGVEVHCASSDGSVIARTDAAGRFEVAPPSLPAALEARAPGFATVRGETLSGVASGEDVVLLVAPAVSVAGRVVDPLGAPIGGASVDVRFGDAAFVALPVLTNMRGVESPRTTSAIDGGFELVNVPAATGITLAFSAEGYVSREIAMPQFSRFDVALELTPALPLAQRVEGEVLDAVGAPVPGATVALGPYRTYSDAEGRFLLRHASYDGLGEIVASKRGFGSASSARAARSGGAHRGLRLTLDGTRSTIEGIVIGPGGAPASGWNVFGEIDDEDESARSSRGAVLGTTDEDGRFAIEGVAERDYALFAYDPASSAVSTLEVVAGDARDVELVPLGLGAAMRIRLVDGRGRPLAGALASAVAAGEGGGSSAWSTLLATAVADADGWVDLHGVGAGSPASVHVRSSVGGRDVLALTGRSVVAGGDVLVPSSAALQVVSATGASAFSVLDGDGEEVDVIGPSTASRRGALFDGRSAPVEVPSDASAIVWYAGDEVIGSEALVLDPERPTLVEN